MLSISLQNDWHLRGAFFDSIVGVAAYVGWQSSFILKPLIQQVSLPLTPSYDMLYACNKGHLEPTHLKSLPLFIFSTKSLSQDSPPVHTFSITIGSRFTAVKIKLSDDSLS